ncbi:MAG: hypothetical protein ACM3UY_09300 [Methanocella sp.]
MWLHRHYNNHREIDCKTSAFHGRITPELSQYAQHIRMVTYIWIDG